MTTTINANNGTMSKAQRKAAEKAAAEQARKAAEEQGSTQEGSADNTNTDTKNYCGPFASKDDAVKAPVKGTRNKKVKDGKKMVQVKNDDGSNATETYTYTLFEITVSVANLQKMIDASKDGVHIQYWYGCQATNARSDWAAHNGAVASQGNGNGGTSKVAAAKAETAAMAKRASEAEMMAATALQARLDAENQLESLKIMLAQLQAKSGQ